MKFLFSILALQAYCLHSMKIMAPNYGRVGEDDDAELILKVGNDKFSARMFREIAKQVKVESFVMSAFSVLFPLTQLAVASEGLTRSEILDAIGFNDVNTSEIAMRGVNKKMKAVKGVELYQANKIYLHQDYTLQKSFASYSKRVFKSEVENVDFRNPGKCARIINKWVRSKTNNRIRNLVDEGSITDQTIAILLNAIYFKGSWKRRFSKRATQTRDFYLNKEDIVPLVMMSQTNKFKYYSSDKLSAKFLEMPYKGDQVSFVIALPYDIEGINELMEKMTNPSNLHEALRKMDTREVEITIPKFKIETSTDLKYILRKMNIKSVFSPGNARLVKLVNEAKDLYVTDAQQKAFIEINEEGSEAGAANEFSIGLGMAKPQQIVEFNANHPFLFFLMQEDFILFTGVFRT